MADVDVDIVGESSLVLTRDGYEKTREYRVYNLTGGTLSAREYEAMQYVPSRKTPHESIPLINVDTVEAEALSGEIVRVRVVYRTPKGGNRPPEEGEAPRVEVFGVLESSVTNEDKDGNLIVVPVPAGQTGEPLRGPQISIQLPRFGVRYTVRQAFAPDDLAAQYVGSVNSTTYKGRPARTWLVGPIRGTSDDGGVTFVNTYELFYNKNTWKARLYWQDSEGKIPEQTATTKDIYPEQNLSGLGV